MKTDNCRSKSCRAPIIWAKSEKGANMPMDADPSDDGTFGLIDQGEDEAPLAVHHKKLEAHGIDPETTELHLSHHATCPDVDHWRR